MTALQHLGDVHKGVRVTVPHDGGRPAVWIPLKTVAGVLDCLAITQIHPLAMTPCFELGGKNCISAGIPAVTDTSLASSGCDYTILRCLRLITGSRCMSRDPKGNRLRICSCLPAATTHRLKTLTAPQPVPGEHAIHATPPALSSLAVTSRGEHNMLVLPQAKGCFMFLSLQSKRKQS